MFQNKEYYNSTRTNAEPVFGVSKFHSEDTNRFLNNIIAILNIGWTGDIPVAFPSRFYFLKQQLEIFLVPALLCVLKIRPATYLNF